MPRQQSSISNGKPMLAAFSIAVADGPASVPLAVRACQEPETVADWLEPAAIWWKSDKDVLGDALRQILHLHYEPSG